MYSSQKRGIVKVTMGHKFPPPQFMVRVYKDGAGPHIKSYLPV